MRKNTVLLLLVTIFSLTSMLEGVSAQTPSIDEPHEVIIKFKGFDGVLVCSTDDKGVVDGAPKFGLTRTITGLCTLGYSYWFVEQVWLDGVTYPIDPSVTAFVPIKALEQLTLGYASE